MRSMKLQLGRVAVALVAASCAAAPMFGCSGNEASGEAVQGVGSIAQALDGAAGQPIALINEVKSNPGGNDDGYEFVELRGAPGATLPNYVYFVAVNGDAAVAGNIDYVRDLSGVAFGANGTILIKSTLTPDGGALYPSTGSTVITDAILDAPRLPNNSVSFAIIRSATPLAIVAGTTKFDTLVGATTVDSIGWVDNGVGDQQYGLGTLQGYTPGANPPDAVARYAGDETANSGAAFYYAQMNSQPQDGVGFSLTTPRTTPFPTDGNLTPGEANVATPAPAVDGGADTGTDDAASDGGIVIVIDAAADVSVPVDAQAGDASSVDSSTTPADGGSSDASTRDASTSTDGGATGQAGTGLVISQVYGGGGNAGAPLNRDFVELFNRSSATVSLAGLSIQYGSATGNFTSVVDGGVINLVVLPNNGSVAPGKHYLVALGTASATTGSALPAFDFEGNASMSGTAGKVALARTTAPLGCGSTRCPTTNVVDMVGYGATATAPVASDFEGAAPTLATSPTTAALRKGMGCVDTNNNAADFDIAAPAPRNGTASAVDCGSLPPGDAGTTADSGTTTDAGRTDAGRTDAGAPSDAGKTDASTTRPDSGASADAGEVVLPDDSSCSCKAAGAGSSQSRSGLALGGLVAMVGAIFARRRRKI